MPQPFDHNLRCYAQSIGAVAALLIASVGLAASAALANTDSQANLHLGPALFMAPLSGDEQTATVTTAASGRAQFSLDRQNLRLTWSLTLNGLNSSLIGVSVNGPQRPGTNAGVQIDLGRAGADSAPIRGSATLTEAQLDYLLAGRMYVNVRTRRYPDGELRGQIQRVPLTPAQLASIPLPSGEAARRERVAPTVEPAARRVSSTTPRVLGFVIADWNNAIYESRFMDECPEGPAIGNDELWWRGLSRDDKDRLTRRGLVQPVDRRFVSVMRGPEGEDVCWNPTVVKDPPLRTVRGPIAYGFDLDGRDDGQATPKSCPHENFVGVDGRRGVDNQMYRLLGCHYGWRRNGVLDTFGNEERRNSGRGVILMEISGVTDLMQSPEVTVGFYRAIDPYRIDSAGRILPWASYRVDTNGGRPRYGAIAKGRIEGGVLKTEPIDLQLPFYGNAAYAELDLKDMRLELDLTADDTGKVHGLVGGYYDFDKWWEYMLKLEFLIATGDWSCPALYAAARELADGYPDAQTGDCTAISSAFKINALPAFVIHGDATVQTSGAR